MDSIIDFYIKNCDDLRNCDFFKINDLLNLIRDHSCDKYKFDYDIEVLKLRCQKCQIVWDYIFADHKENIKDRNYMTNMMDMIKYAIIDNIPELENNSERHRSCYKCSKILALINNNLSNGYCDNSLDNLFAKIKNICESLG